ncbi:MAG: S8 family serine peptidase [Solirubrobacterales bacterium]
MRNGKGLCRLWGWLAALAIACSLAPAAAAVAAVPVKGHGPLSPTLAKLARPAVRTLPPARQARALGVAPSGPGSLLRQGGRVLVSVRFDHGALAYRDDLRAAGGRVLSASRRYQSATVAVPPADLRSLTAIPAVASVAPIRTPMLFADNCEGGSVISEGVAQLNAKTAREEFSVDGSGIKVGVLSDSYDQATEAATGGPIETHAKEDEETADLPGAPGNECSGQALPVNVLEDFESEEATDEGRGMLQIVHDMAPNASLAFATAFTGEEEFAGNIKKLALAGAKVIVDDVGYFEEPMFQDGPIAVAINEVTALGDTYLSAAGNDNMFDGEGNEIASWEAPEFRDSGACPAKVAALPGFNASHCMDFNPEAPTDRTFGIKVEPGEVLTVDLQWAEPWEGVETDLDAILLDANGNVLTGSAESNEETQRPLEIVQWENKSASTQTVQLVINRFSGPGARLKFILLENGGGVSEVEYPRSGGGDVVGPTIMGHAGAASAISVGAMRYEPRPGEGEEPEFYSSRGPVTHLFEPAEGTGPAAPVPGGEEVLSKPDVTATDCGGTTFFAVLAESEWHFCGTSAAAPHAAGAVALMRQAAPLASPELLRESLIGTASPIGVFGSCAVGGGLVETVAAVEAAREEITPTAPEECEPPDASGSVFVAPGNWGIESPPTPPTPEPTPPPTPTAPATSFLKHPPKVVKTRSKTARVVFRFGSDQAGVTFLCKIDRAAFRACGGKLTHRFGVGSHTVKVKAVSSAGLADSTPAVFRFRVKHVG